MKVERKKEKKRKKKKKLLSNDHFLQRNLFVLLMLPHLHEVFFLFPKVLFLILESYN